MIEKTVLAKIFSITLVFLWAQIALAQASNEQNKAFKVVDISIQADSNDLSNAEAEAVLKGTLDAFKTLLFRLCTNDQKWKIENAPIRNVFDFVKKTSIRDERKTAFRYMATMDVVFDEAAVKNFLGRNGFKYFISYSPVQLVIPIVKKDEKYMIWEDEKWMDSWGEMPNELGLLKLAYLMGDLGDTLILNPKAAAEAKFPYFQKALEKYNAEEVVLIIGAYEGDKFKVTLQHLSSTDNGSKTMEYNVIPKSNIEAFYQSVANDALQEIDNYFKSYDTFNN
ncbi:MAG: hypothetical protein K0R73_1209 [Candidatus Midichloriaceae bacterium]|jgi:hypothetical protein|nr:hypothetical protein [Candidatus Midichloriaceae bacterium]